MACKGEWMTGEAAMKQVGFALDVQEGWPPATAEWVWCEEREGIFELLSAPFFIEGLAVGDQFRADPDAANGLIFAHEIVRQSAHSLMRVLDTRRIGLEYSAQYLLTLGCRIARPQQFGMIAVDVPPEVDGVTIATATDQLRRVGFALSFPVWRHP